MEQYPTNPQPPHRPQYIPPPYHSREPIREPKKPSEGWKSIFSTAIILIAAPLIAILLINFVFQSYEVDGPSMETTLSDGDRLIVWKVPRTISKITNNDYIPARGDIVVFYKTGLYDQERSENRQLIKRVLGVPGDRIIIRDGVVTVYNSANRQGFNPDETDGYEAIVQSNSGNDLDITIPEGEVFLAGDNRVNSLDSRSFGTVPVDSIVGKLVFRLTPLNKAQAF
jgi:signal peptidase I